MRLNQLDLPKSYIFDEDMHAFTAYLMAKNDQRAYEWWHQPFSLETVRTKLGLETNFFYRKPAIEWLHPPLSKIMEAISIKLFGNNSLSWRLAPALAGSFLVVFIFLVIQELTSKNSLAVLAGLVATFDNFLVTQSQIASTDIFVSFFTLVTIWTYSRFYKTKNNRWWWLIGLVIGLTVASKWSGIFILPALIIFDWLRRKNWQNWIIFWIKIIFISLIIYVLSYSQMFFQGKNINQFFELHRQAWWYQTHANFSHPYQSQPQEWLIGQKPVWYFYQKAASNQARKQIVARPSSWILFFGELSILGLMIKTLIKMTEKRHWLNYDTLTLISFFCLFGFWFLIKRPLFIYHFLPAYSMMIVSIFLWANSLKLKI